MQTSYSVNSDRAVEGMPVGDRETAPKLFPYVAQVTTLTIAAGEAGDWTVTVVDDATQQSYSVTCQGHATEATALDNLVAAWALTGELRTLFSIAEDGATVATLTSQHPGRSYTITSTTPGSMTCAVADTTDASTAGLNFGRFVARGSNDGEIAELGASTTLAQLEGVTFRTDANHFHDLDGDTPSASDLLAGGKYLSIMKRGRMWMVAEDAVTPASTPYVRRAQTSGAGTVGRIRGSVAGSTQVATITPTADHPLYAIEFGYKGIHYSFQYRPTDGTTTADDAVDGLEDAAAAVVPTGVTASAASGVTMTLTAAAGTAFDYVRSTAFGLDTEAASASVSLAASDVDTIDVSSICEFETTAAAGALVLVRLKR